MSRVWLEIGRGALRTDGGSRHHLLRGLWRSLALLIALLLLQLLLACRTPDFEGACLEKDRLATLKTFCIDRQPNPSLYIWNMRSIPFEEMKGLVSTRLVEKGYREVPSEVADFRVVLTTFTEESTPRYRISILEMVDQRSSRKLWSGRAEIPYRVDPGPGLEHHPTLVGFLDLIPSNSRQDPSSSSPSRKG